MNDFNTPTRSKQGDLSNNIDPETKIMIEDARADFSNPFVEIFDCDNCEFSIRFEGAF